MWPHTYILSTRCVMGLVSYCCIRDASRRDVPKLSDAKLEQVIARRAISTRLSA